MGRKEDVISEEFVVTQDFCGPKIKRKCSDVLFLILLLVCWAVMTCEINTPFNLNRKLIHYKALDLPLLVSFVLINWIRGTLTV